MISHHAIDLPLRPLFLPCLPNFNVENKKVSPGFPFGQIAAWMSV